MRGSFVSRVLAIDLGDKRVGLAISDALGITAQPLATYLRKSPEEDLAHFAGLVKGHGVGTVVVGLPLNMDGSEGPAVAKIRAFRALLEPRIAPVPVVEFDERMTTQRAARELRPLGRQSTHRRRGELDRAAAQLLLGTYLAARSAG